MSLYNRLPIVIFPGGCARQPCCSQDHYTKTPLLSNPFSHSLFPDTDNNSGKTLHSLSPPMWAGCRETQISRQSRPAQPGDYDRAHVPVPHVIHTTNKRRGAGSMRETWLRRPPGSAG